MRHTSARLSVLTVSTALLLTGVVAATPSAQGAEPDLRDHRRGRAGQVIAHVEEPVGTRSRSRGDASPSQVLPGRRTVESGNRTLETCDSFALSAVHLGDRMDVRAHHADAASLQVQRQRQGGEWKPVFTAVGETAQGSDRDINLAAVFSYRLTAKSSTGAVLRDCETDRFAGAWDGGRLDPDFVIGANGQLLRQAFWDTHVTAHGVTGTHVTPAFSADGRLIASTVVDPTTGSGQLVVRESATDAVQFTLDLGPDVTAADAAFSPDGQTLAFTRYENQSGVSLGLGFTDVHGTHALRAHGVALPLAEPTWRADSSGLVASDLRDDAGLVSTCVTCTSATAIPATTGGYTPEVGADGVLRFALTDATTSRIVRHTGTAVVTVATGEADKVLSMPRTSPDGRLHYLVEDDDVPWGWAVPARVLSLPRHGGLEFWRNAVENAYGFDVRQLATKDSSDVVGDAHHDLIARDTAGVLWAYTAQGWGLGRRVRLGGGWNGFTRILAAGDLTSDDRADLLATDSLGKLWLWKGTGRGSFSAKVQIGSGWSSSYTLVAPGDLTGDQKADLVGRDASGRLWLWAGTGRGAVGTKTALGSGWNNQNAILGSGDVTFDGRADLVSRDVRGRLWVWPGDGKGRLGTARVIGTGWGSFTSLSVTGVTHQVAHVWARTPSGVLNYWDLSGDGSFSPNGVTTLGSGWNSMTLITS